MKRRLSLSISVILLLALVVCFFSCKGADKTNVWDSATYTENTELGEGAKTMTVEVKAENKTITFTIKTDADTVGEALLEHSLIAGEDSEFGLYIKVVNGITADYDVDQSYWAFYINGETAMTGVDGETITEGAAYRLEYAK